MMSNLIGVIVDGQGDFASIKKRFSGAVRVIKTNGPRGHTVTTSQLASRSIRDVEILAASGCLRAILVIDFEERAVNYQDFVESLNNEIKRHYFPIDLKVCVVNRMIENWYLADIEQLSANKKYIRNGLKQRQYEGTHGKNELKKVFEHEFSYNEVIHGPDLFCEIRFDVGEKHSASLKAFLDELQNKNKK